MPKSFKRCDLLVGKIFYFFGILDGSEVITDKQLYHIDLRIQLIKW